MMIRSNRTISEWGAVIATTILDRLLHQNHSHVFTIRGDSFRLRAKRRSGFLHKTTAPETATGVTL